MIGNMVGFLIFLSICGIVASNPERGVDCRKFVFAPLCRGVAAKRGVVDTGHSIQDIYISDESFRHLLKNLYNAMSLLGMLNDEYDQAATSLQQTNQNEAGKLARTNRPNSASTLMFENKRSSSEKDNFSRLEYENL